MSDLLTVQPGKVEQLLNDYTGRAYHNGPDSFAAGMRYTLQTLGLTNDRDLHDRLQYVHTQREKEKKGRK